MYFNRLKILIVLLLMSCSGNDDLFSLDSIENFTSSSKKGNTTEQIVEVHVMKLKEYVFVKVHNSEQVGKISIEDLQIIYENYYKQDSSYTVFLYEVLNFKRAIPIKFFYNPKEIYTLDEKIMSIYRKFGMERIKKIYTVEKEEGKFYINSTLKDESFVTIQYLFYINKYEYHNDDYSSLQWFIKVSDFSLYS